MDKKRVSKSSSKSKMHEDKIQISNIENTQMQNPDDREIEENVDQDPDISANMENVDQDPDISANMEIIRMIFSEEQVQRTKYDTNVKKKNRDYYIEKGYKKKLKSKGKQQINEPDGASQFTAQKGISILHNLIRLVSNENLKTKIIKKVYNYILENYQNQVPEEERQSYQRNPDRLKLKVYRETIRRQNKGLLSKRDSQKQESQSNINDDQNEVPLMQNQSVPNSRDLEEQKNEKPQKVVRNSLQIKTRNTLQKQQNQSLSQYLVPQKKPRKKSLSPISQQLFEQLQNLLEYSNDSKKGEEEVQDLEIQSNKVNEVDIQMNEIQLHEEEEQRPHEEEQKPHQEEQKPHQEEQERVSSVHEIVRNENLEHQCSQTQLIQKVDQPLINQEYDIDGVHSNNKEIQMAVNEEESFQILEITSPKMKLLDMKEPHKVTPLKNKSLKSQLSIPQSLTSSKLGGKNLRQASSRSSGSLLESIRQQQNKTKQEQSKVNPSIAVTEKQNSLAVLLNKRVDGISASEQRKQKRLQLEEKEKILKSDQLSDYFVKLYQLSKQLYPAENVDSFTIHSKRLSNIELCGTKLKFLSLYNQNYLDQNSMDVLLSHMSNIEKSNVKNWVKSLKKNITEAITLYNLNKDSVFLHVQSGCGVSCLQANLKTQCLTYGLETNLAALLGSYWLRSSTKSYIEKVDNKKSFDLYKTQFLHIDYVSLDKFAIGDIGGLPVTHIFIPQLDPELVRFNKLVEILLKTPFSMLVWPKKRSETAKIFQKTPDSKMLPDLHLIQAFNASFQFGGETMLYIYIRSPTPEFLENRNSLDYLEMVTKNESKKIIGQMDSLKANKTIQLACYYIPTCGGDSDRRLTWKAENMKSKQSSSSKKKKSADKVYAQNKNTPQSQTDNDGFQTIIKELKTYYPGVVPRKIVSVGHLSVVITAFNNKSLRTEIIKISKKRYGNLLKEEYEKIELLKKKIKNSCFLVDVFHLYTHQFAIHKKDIKKGYDNLRACIFQKFYPMNLSQFLKESKFLKFEVIQHLFVSAAYGVKEIHALDYAHRDLKPQNIFIDNNFKSVIGDFGFCCKAITNQFELNGTPHFLPIEFFSGALTTLQAEYDYRKADIWSLGVTLFNMIYSENPFEIIREPNGQIKLPLRTEEVEKVFKRNFLPESVPPKLELNQKSLKIALDLIQLMLTFDHNKRCNIDQVLGHKFCQIPIEIFKTKGWSFVEDDEKIQTEFQRMTMQIQSEYANI